MPHPAMWALSHFPTVQLEAETMMILELLVIVQVLLMLVAFSWIYTIIITNALIGIAIQILTLYLTVLRQVYTHVISLMLVEILRM